MSLYGNHNPARVTVQFGAIVLQGLAKSTFVKVARNDDAFTYEPSGDGNGARTQSADKSGTVEVTLVAGSPSNDDLNDAAEQDEQSGAGVKELFVKDLNGNALAHAATAWVKKRADLERGTEQGNTTWMFETNELDLQQGGLTPIPGT